MCQACNHPERAALEQDIHAGLPPARVAKMYGLRYASVTAHEHWHMRRPARIQPVNRERQLPETDIELARVDRILQPSSIHDENPEPPFTRFKQAWHDVQDDPRERARMVAWLNEEIQADDMGLP